MDSVIPAIIDIKIFRGSPKVFLYNFETTSLMYWGFVAKNTILELQNTTSKRINKILNYLLMHILHECVCNNTRANEQQVSLLPCISQHNLYYVETFGI